MRNPKDCSENLFLGDKLKLHYLFIYFFLGLGATPSGAQRLFLALSSEIALGRLGGRYGMLGIEPDSVQGKHPTHCAIVPAPEAPFLKQQ